MKKYSLYWCLLLTFFFLAGSLSAQNNNFIRDSKYRLGVISGKSTQRLINVKYEYRVQFFQLQFFNNLISKESWGLDLLIQPQYNRTTFRFVDFISSVSSGFEFGVNAGIIARRYLVDDLLSIYGLLSFGPHYISGAPNRQSPGFIFSDNILVGSNIKVIKNVYLDFRVGLRHISNAGLLPVNGGINSFVLSGGIFINLD